MKLITLSGWPLLSLWFVGHFAVAGNADHSQVAIDLENQTAQGSFYDARHSEDGNQYIFCRAQAQSPSAKPYVICEARDHAGEKLNCFSFYDRYIDLVLNIDSYSKVSFAVEPNSKGNPICKRLSVQTELVQLD